MQLYFPPEVQALVQRWAAACELIESAQRPVDTQDFYLWWDDGRLVLFRGRDPRGVCLQPDEFRRRATLRGELARACGVTAARKPRILDAMAGLGVDGMTLNALGCPVVMIEREPALWVLLDSFARMFGLHERDCEMVFADAWSWLEKSVHDARRFAVVYLDPMFPARRKGALPGKTMQFLAELTEPDRNALTDWIDLAKTHATDRVVLKRRQRDPSVGTPDWQIHGRSVRYDVYRGTAV